MTLLEEYTRALRALLAGERISLQSRYVQLDDVALDWAPSAPPDLWLGGAGPKALALTGRLGDGSILGTAQTQAEIEDACRRIHEASDSDRHPIAATLIVATGPDAQERIDRELPQWGKTAGEDVGVASDAQGIAEVFARLASSGVTSVAVHATADEPDLTGLLHLLGQDVRPLVRDL